MIEKLRSMAIFATVVDQKTFRAAAEHLGLAPSRVSQVVSDLESELGVTLLHRSTRQLSLTNEGHILYTKVSQMLAAAETGLDSINLISSQPSGELRVTAPAFVTQTGLMNSLAEFSQEYPQINLKINFSDHPRELIKEGFDVGIRAGWLKDSEMLSRNIGQTKRLLVASPDYVASKPNPNNPSDLEHWQWIHFSMRPERAEFISKQGESASVTCNARIEVDSAHALYEFAVRNQGLTQLPEHLARQGIEKGELVHVIPDWSVRPLSFIAIWPDRSRRESLALIFVRFLAERSNQI
jgi:DNA-binding transcriptional LysR family regulator